MTYKKILDVLVNYAISEGYFVDLEYHGISYVRFSKNTLNEPKLIRIQTGHSAEVKVYYLLHELGHHELRKDWERFRLMLPYSAYAEEMELLTKSKKYFRRVAYKISSMEEEFLAWREGLILANKLGVSINLKRYNKLRERCLILYLRYYGRKD